MFLIVKVRWNILVFLVLHCKFAEKIFREFVAALLIGIAVKVLCLKSRTLIDLRNLFLACKFGSFETRVPTVRRYCCEFVGSGTRVAWMTTSTSDVRVRFCSQNNCSNGGNQCHFDTISSVIKTIGKYKMIKNCLYNIHSKIISNREENYIELIITMAIIFNSVLCWR